ncbi:MAG: TonB family protein [Deltaproteobacteria bacterium]|nr:TonB family protein [Deltaproteobacteria bacterium]
MKPLDSSKATRWPRWILAALALSLLLHGTVSWVLWSAVQDYSLRRAVALRDELAKTPVEIIDLTEPANAIRPERARFIGKADNTTSQETVAPARRPQAAAAAEKAPTPAVKPAAPRTRSRPTPEAVTQPMPEPRLPRRVRLPATAVEADLGQGTPALPEDYFPNFKRGAHTYVNVLRHPGVDYFVELKRALKIAWNPRTALQRSNGAPPRQRHTIEVVLGVAVDAAGTLQELFVLQGSGLGAYDSEALRAFRATFPFFEPPAKLLALDGERDALLRMSWSFIVFL